MRQRLIPSVNRPWNYRVKVGTSWDPDFSSFNAIAGITDPLITIPVNDFYLGTKADDCYVHIHDFLPVVGGTAGIHAVWGKNPAGAQVSWVGSPTHDLNGVKYNGTSQYGITEIIPNVDLTQHTSFGLVYYSDNLNGASAYGSASDASFYSLFNFIARDASNNTHYRNYGSVNAVVLSGVTTSKGCHLMNRTSSSLLKYFKDGIAVSTNTNANQTIRSTRAIILGARDLNGVINAHDNHTAGFYAFGSGLSDAQATLLSNRVMSLQTALGRA